jgi:hypothetical protein
MGLKFNPLTSQLDMVGSSAAAAGAVAAKDEGVSLTATVASIDFVGAGVTATHTGGDVTVTIPGGGGSYTNEDAQDAVGAMIADTATIDLTYTDATPELKADVKADSIDNTLLANMAVNTIRGRITAGTGDPEDLTAANVRTIINVANGATANSSDATLLARANHTGTQTLATISDVTASATEVNYTTGVTSAIQTQLGTKQPLDGELTAIAGLTSAANKLPYFTGSGTAAVTDFTAAGRALVDDADAAAQRVTLSTYSTSEVDTLINAAAANVGKRARTRAATTANITISTALNNADTLDGVTLATGDLVLVKNQTAPEENGVYVVGAVPARSTEFDTYNEHPGSLISVAEGSTNVDTLWLCTSNDGGTLNTTSIAFSKMIIAGELLATNNLSDVANASTSRST